MVTNTTSVDNVLRIGIRKKQCALVVEYTKINNKGKKELRHRRVYLEDYIVKNYPELDEEEIVENIKQNVLFKHHHVLFDHIPDHQIEKMVRQLVDHTTKSFLPPEQQSQPNKSNTVNNNEKQKLTEVLEEEDIEEEDFEQFDDDEDDFKGQDLNKLDDQSLKRVKARMDENFKQLKPGDAGYVYDKQVDFDNVPKTQSSWDD
ncbi:hypothetical protein C9374_003299 [Naegleria lovaniensis]|uniref:Centrosomal protein of 19 kDa n=1 Tax=Naegleria lovaniensis TaxID=51637 RepID=A0AA88GST8_NAELO|nr:uncharacterized protein C9374_003299 [Naegleria lovaniensis]KAG2385484.1 hypothetical protein C9374_003299 [Naegleria lovaniensis]